jgi:hypothetical protein
MTLPSIIKHPGLALNALHHRAEFRQGWSEALDSNGVTYDDDPESDRSRAYDTGRDLRLWGRA